jgi:hypothetical protein
LSVPYESTGEQVAEGCKNMRAGIVYQPTAKTGKGYNFKYYKKNNIELHSN